MSLTQMKERLGKTIKPIGIGILYGYALYFNKSPGGYANIRETANEKVFGVVYELTDEDIKKLDSYEGVPKDYEKKFVEIELGGAGKRIKCFTYVAVKTDDNLKPKKEYLKRIIEGAKENNIPEEYIKEIKMKAGICM